MKSLCLIAVAVFGTAVTWAADVPEIDISKAPELFEQFIIDYNKEYKDELDKQIHYEAFVKSLYRINELNANDDNAVYGINSFADYTEEEKKHLHGLRPLRSYYYLE